MRRRSGYSSEVGERAVRQVVEQLREYAPRREAICSIAAGVGCTAETLRKWKRQADADGGSRDVGTAAERQRMKELEREVREPRRANEHRRKAWVYLAQAVPDRGQK